MAEPFFNKDRLAGSWAAGFVRSLGVAVVTSLIIIGLLVFAFRGQTNEEQRVARDTLNANLAQACVLALPVSEEGRDPYLVTQCFTQYGLPAPEFPGQ